MKCNIDWGRRHWRVISILGTFHGRKVWVIHHSSVSQSVSSVTQSCLTLCDPVNHARPPCPSPTPGVYSNPWPSSWWCHPTISTSVVPFSSCPQSLPALGSFPVSQLFTWGGQSIGVSASASVPPMNTQDWSPLGWTGWSPRDSQESSPTPLITRAIFSLYSSVFDTHSLKTPRASLIIRTL